MSKTFTREERRRRRSDYRRNEGKAKWVEYTRRSEQPAVITPDWAGGRRADHVRFRVGNLVEAEIISDSDIEDYIDMVNRRIRKSVSEYDASRPNAQGRTSSAVHFFTVVVDNEILHIRDYFDRRAQHMTEVPLSRLPKDEAEKLGYVSVESEELSDQCKCVRDIDFRMDVKTLVGMLTPSELTVFKMRLGGCTNTEIGDELGCSRQNVENTYLKHIRRKARACGFVPPSEARKGAS